METETEVEIYPLKKYCAVNNHDPREKVYIYATGLRCGDIITLVNENAPSGEKFLGFFNTNDWAIFEIEAAK